MQAGDEHVHADEGEGGDGQARQRPPGGHSAAQALDQAHVQPAGVVEPDDERPGFLGVPAPVAAPGIGGPESAQHGGNGEEGKAHGDGLVHHVIEHLEGRQPLGNALAAQHDEADDGGGHDGVAQPVAAACAFCALGRFYLLQKVQSQLLNYC